MRLDLDNNAVDALATALDRYIDGYGMDENDEDEPVLDDILAKLRESWRR